MHIVDFRRLVLIVSLGPILAVAVLGMTDEAAQPAPQAGLFRHLAQRAGGNLATVAGCPFSRA